MKEEKKAKHTFESTLKSLDTEEFIDIHFYRPIGYQWALLFNKLNISPNTVTIASIFIGIAAGICFYFNDLVINIAGMLLLIWANSYDSADGQLARMTGKSSPLGRVLDGACGDLWFISIYAAICLRLTPEWGIWIWLLGAITGFFHSKQASMADYYRNIHLLFLKGESGSELSKSDKLEADFVKLSWSKDFIYKLFGLFYLNYTKSQEQLTPKFQKMMETIHLVYSNNIPDEFRRRFREKSLPLMKYTNMLSFNTRVIALFVSLFVNMPWLYFIFEITVLNIMLVYMVITHESFCDQFRKDCINTKQNNEQA
ncbi:CDP-alcohol phosphatidyltransferase family protein [Massilibacteroides vaginae]|uniref:CDP-alcohol phosphatidyltransferase family protein n=1 Tax=Massilibacteroides vaginae TaxID=1673718 RepID=UPI000A1CAB3A|nr:CDP-alcohol phosphatidyltransferase family protein [Massilibacteroides vaginae]